MGHTWEFSSDIRLAGTSWRFLTFLLIILSRVECDGKGCSNDQVDLKIECSIGRKTFAKDLCSCSRESHSLRKLIIRGNKNLKRLPEGLLGNLTTSLEVLDIQQNSLPMAPPVHHLTNLSELLLADNPIPILDSNYLKNNSKLILFKATRIGLSEVPKDLFKTTIRMKFLHLDGNKIATLAEDIFWKLESLQVLNLAGNQLSSLSVTIFKDLSSLRHLDMGSNNLDSNITEILSPSSPIRSNLKILKLSRNRLEKFELTLLKIFPLIKKVSLDQNKISANITEDQLDFAHKVTVDLKSNLKIRVILNDFAQCNGGPRVKLYLSENNLDKDCFKTKLTADLKKVKRHCIEIPDSETWEPGLKPTCPFPYGDLIPDKCSTGCNCSFNVTSKESLVDCSNNRTISFNSDIPHVQNKTSSIQLVLKRNGITDLESIFRGVELNTLNKIRLLDLSENKIGSNVDTSNLPQNLTYLYLNNNTLSGVTEEAIDFFKNNLKAGVKLGGNNFACSCQSTKLIGFLKTSYSKVLDRESISFDCMPSEAYIEEGNQMEDRVCPKLGRNALVAAVIICLFILCVVLLILRKKEVIQFRVSSHI